MAKRKINYPPNRKPAGNKECPVCGKVCKARGFKGHLLFVHKLKWEQLTEVSPATPEVTRVSKDGTGSKNKSNSSKIKNTEKLPAKSKRIQETPEKNQVSQEPGNTDNITRTQVSQNTRLDLPPRYNVDQMKAMERAILTEGLIEVRLEPKANFHKPMRYCTMVGSDHKIKWKVYRIDAFKSGKVPVWWYNEVISIDAKGLVAHFDSVIKNSKRNRLFNEATQAKGN